MTIGDAVIRPYGTWPSPLAAAQVAAASVKLAEPRLCDGRLYWLEGRPLEGGRQVVMERRPDGLTRELLPAPYSARSRVHEYGGGSYTVAGGHLYFVNQADQQIYCMPLSGGAPHALTHAHGRRFADITATPNGTYLVAVCEQHSDHAEPENTLVAVDLRSGNLRLVASGADFYASPSVSADGALCYLAWNHPHMPWDAAALWVASSLFDSPHRQLAGGNGSAVFQPSFGPAGELFFVDDRSGYGNLYQVGPDTYGAATPLFPAELEFGLPQWVFGQRSYAVLDSDRLLVTYIQRGRGRSGLLIRQPGGTWQLRPFADELVEFSAVTAAGGEAFALAASETEGSQLLQLVSELWQPLKHEPASLPPDAVSRAVPFTFETPAGPGYGFFYAPQSATASAPPGTLPPFITICHGGPTGASSAAYSDRVQFWTSRGFAVIDVNYRGSTGFGRPYREALNGQWGLADAEDCASAARTAIARGWVSPRGAIRGSSAGGLTVLRALLDSDVFTAGVVLYGVLDLTRLVADTHKFEKHYTDSLIAPWPEGRAVYEARSPAAEADRLRQPLLLFQGLEDKVVPPSQAEAFVAAARAAGAAVTYRTYAGEGHGFRRAETLEDCLRSELEFYQKVLVESAGNQEPV